MITTKHQLHLTRTPKGRESDSMLCCDLAGSALRKLAAALALSSPSIASAEQPPTPKVRQNAGAELGEFAPVGRRIADANMLQIVRYQELEDRRAKQERRPARDLYDDVQKGVLYLPERSTIFNESAVVPAPQAMEALLKSELASLAQGSLNARSVDSSIALLLRRWWEQPADLTQLDESTRDRKLSPVEIEAKIHIYRAECSRTANGIGRYPFMLPQQFERALHNFYDLLGPVAYRPPDALVDTYRNGLIQELAAAGLPESISERLLVQFNEFYDSLPSRQFLAASTRQTRLLSQYQVREDSVASTDRPARNVFLEFERGSFFAPDLDPRNTIVYRRGVPPCDFEDMELRPSPAEQVAELGHLESLLKTLGISAHVQEQIIAVRKKAWEGMADRYSDRFEKLIWRTPGAEELEVIASYYGARLRRKGLKPEEIECRVRSLREYYESRPQDQTPVGDETRRDIKANYEALMKQCRNLTQEQIEERLGRFDATSK